MYALRKRRVNRDRVGGVWIGNVADWRSEWPCVEVENIWQVVGCAQPMAERLGMDIERQRCSHLDCDQDMPKQWMMWWSWLQVLSEHACLEDGLRSTYQAFEHSSLLVELGKEDSYQDDRQSKGGRNDWPHVG